MTQNVVYDEVRPAVEQTLGVTIYPGTEIMTDGTNPVQHPDTTTR